MCAVFLPVGGDNNPDEVLERGYDSLSDEEEDGPGLEYAYEENIFNNKGISLCRDVRCDRLLLSRFSFYLVVKYAVDAVLLLFLFSIFYFFRGVCSMHLHISSCMHRQSSV